MGGKEAVSKGKLLLLLTEIVWNRGSSLHSVTNSNCHLLSQVPSSSFSVLFSDIQLSFPGEVCFINTSTLWKGKQRPKEGR